MATQITPGATADQVGQRQQTIRGKLTGNRQLRGVALIAALVLALAASLAISRAWSSDPAVSSAPGQYPVIQQDPDADAATMAQQARPADTFDFEQWERTQTGMNAGLVPGFTAYREDHRPVVGPAYTFPEVYGDDEAAAPRGVPTSPAYQFPAVYGDDEVR